MAQVHGGRSRRMLVVIALAAMVASGAVVNQGAEAAWAADYPSWTDVQNARSSEAAKKAEIVRLQALLAQLQANVESTQAESERKGQEYYEAQLEYDGAAYKAEQLQLQADEAKAVASESMRKAGQIAARVQRAGGQDLSMQLIFGDEGSTDLLSNLGMASKVNQQSGGIYAKAKRDQNTAQAITDEVNVAKEELKKLAAIAEAAMVEAQKAAEAAEAALREQDGNQERLEAQLASLVENRELTEAQYAVGAEIRRKAEEARQAELRRLAELERQRQEAEGGGPSASGWARPAPGYASESSFGYRVPPFNGASSQHMGTDFGAGCGTNIYAAGSGRVIYSGPNGGFGNFVKIDHGGGITTSYAHMSQVMVGYGQNVSPGQVVGKAGMTGTANGCHLHFEVRTGGNATNPVPFLRARGVNI